MHTLTHSPTHNERDFLPWEEKSHLWLGGIPSSERNCIFGRIDRNKKKVSSGVRIAGYPWGRVVGGVRSAGAALLGGAQEVQRPDLRLQQRVLHAHQIQLKGGGRTAAQGRRQWSLGGDRWGGFCPSGKAAVVGVDGVTLANRPLSGLQFWGRRWLKMDGNYAVPRFKAAVLSI